MDLERGMRTVTIFSRLYHVTQSRSQRQIMTEAISREKKHNQRQCPRSEVDFSVVCIKAVSDDDNINNKNEKIMKGMCLSLSVTTYGPVTISYFIHSLH